MKQITANNGKNTNGAQEGDTVEVLYQKMGNRWFAFSLIDDEVFVGSITQDEIDKLEKGMAAQGAAGSMYKVSGNS